MFVAVLLHDQRETKTLLLVEHTEDVTDTWITDWIDNLLSHADQLRAAGASHALARGRQVPPSWSPLGRLLASLRASGPSRSHRRRHERGQHGHPRLDRRPHVWGACIPRHFSCGQAQWCSLKPDLCSDENVSWSSSPQGASRAARGGRRRA